MAIKVKGADLQFVRNLATNYKLVPLLERGIAREEFEWTFDHKPKQGDDGWHPSGHCTPSVYDLYMGVAHPAEDDRSGMLKTFMVGHFFHQYLQTVVVREGLADEQSIERRGTRGWGEMGTALRRFPHFEDPILWKPHHWASGAADVAPCVIPGHGEYLIDFKTQNSMSFRRQRLPEWAEEKYEAQINIYMDMFNLDKALIVCINKDSPHDMKEFEYRLNQPLVDAIYAKWRLVSMCLDEGVTPPEDEDIELPFEGPCK